MSEASPYELTVDGVRALSVHAIRGSERISEAWRFDLTVTAPGEGPDIERDALGARATLVLHTADAPRAFYGVVASARLLEVLSGGEHRYRLRVVPRFSLLEQNQRTRIFQQMRVPDIVSLVLAESGIGVRWQLVRPYPVLEYCTQYEETDAAFIRRLLAEAGILFYFFTGGPSNVPTAALASGIAAVPGDTVVGADDAVCYPPIGYDDQAALAAATAASLALGAADSIAGAAVSGAVAAIVGSIGASAPTLSFAARGAGHTARRDQVGHFAIKSSVRPTGAAFRDFDPDRPQVRIQSVAASTAPFPPGPADVAAMAAAVAANAAGAASMATGEGSAAASAAGAVSDIAGAAVRAAVAHEVYEHHGRFLFPKWGYSPDAAPLILRQKRRRALRGTGESGNAMLSPAHRFQLAGHPAPHLDGAYVLVRVEHRGALRQGDAAHPESYSNTFECVPASMTYPPARPKRRSVQVNLTASVVGSGAEEIHVDARSRIKVQFHWDREGAMDDKSSCWIRVMQPWGGAGWGVQFIPRVGMEVVVGFEGGDPDKPMVLGTLYNGTHPTPFPLPHDKTRSGWRTSSSPGGDGHNELSFEDRKGGEQIYLHAQRDLEEDILNDHQTRVARDRRSVIGGNKSDDTAGSCSYRVAGDKSEIVGESYSLSIGDSRKLAIHGSDQERVSHSRTTQVVDRYGLQVGGMSVMVGTSESPSISETFVWGAYLVGADGNMELTSDRSITLRCGDSTIELSKEGIKLKGKTVLIEGSKATTLKGNGPCIDLRDEGKITAKTLTLVSSKGSVVLTDDVEVAGESVKLNCKGIDASKLTSEDGTPQTKKVSVKLVDAEAKPYAGTEYILTAGGARFEGTTDSDGKLELDVPKDAEVAQVVLYVGGRPEGRQIRYRIALEALPENPTKAALTRLRNLGYYWGEPAEALDAVAQAAIREFQRDNDLPVTGELDEATLGKLSSHHGH